jgi:hypothetical protein
MVVWGSKTAFRHGYSDQEVSAELKMLCNADTPTPRYADTFPLAAGSTVSAGFGHLDGV